MLRKAEDFKPGDTLLFASLCSITKAKAGVQSMSKNAPRDDGLLPNTKCSLRLST